MADRRLPRPPRELTVARVLLLLAGAGTAFSGLRQLNPAAATPAHVLGWALIALGALCWVVALLLRRPGPRREAEAVVPDASRLRRVVAGLGVVGVTAGALGVLTAAGAGVALWPCGFSVPANPGLRSQAVSTDTGTRPSGWVTASDGVALAFYADLPPDPVATLVFYHGSGANSLAGYLPLGRQLAARYRVATYLVDIRGHGASGGPRGDAPTPEQVWQDTATLVDYVHRRHPSLPEFAGGHSAGAGLVLNSLDRIQSRIAGVVFLAPDFGFRSNTARQTGFSNFATVCQRPFVVNALTNHALDGHAPAVGFAYTPAEVRDSGLIPRYTVNMALAQNPAASADDLHALTRPLGLWIGARDEVIDPNRVLAYAGGAHHAPGDTLRTVPGDDHLGILNDGAGWIGPWIDRRAA